MSAVEEGANPDRTTIQQMLMPEQVVNDEWMYVCMYVMM